MGERERVAGWLDAYVRAWESYDPTAIGDLFAEDAEYFYGPFDEPVRGREAIVASWLGDRRDEPGTYRASYAPIAVEGDVAVANGRRRYFQGDGTTLVAEYDNIFVLRFGPDGRCREFREWFMERPKGEG